MLSSVETGVNYAPMEAGSGVKFTLRARTSVVAIMTVLKNDRRSGHKKAPCREAWGEGNKRLPP